ncbi:putative transcription factor C2H2 family [Dioscorea sansibarensis]
MYFSSPSPATASPLSGNPKKKRRPAGTPDPDAEVVALSPKTLLESDRYVCEICGQGFQRDQNLQMHRRRHKVPWKLVKRDATESSGGGGSGSEVRKRVYVCPESSCLHHDPAHALGDLVGIKKHFRRKHSAHKQWVCARCGKGYAVQSDYKAHLKTCGTRGHTCDCGRVFSRVESFIEHQDACMANQACNQRPSQCIELQLLPTCNNTDILISSSTPSSYEEEEIATNLKLSIGPEPRGMDEEAKVEKVMADQARENAKRQKQMAEFEFNNAKRIRQRAQAELEQALALRQQAINQINVSMLEITCHACKKRFSSDETSPTAVSYMSSVVTEGEGENENQNHEP